MTDHIMALHQADAEPDRCDLNAISLTIDRFLAEYGPPHRQFSVGAAQKPGQPPVLHVYAETDADAEELPDVFEGARVSAHVVGRVEAL